MPTHDYMHIRSENVLEFTSYLLTSDHGIFPFNIQLKEYCV